MREIEFRAKTVISGHWIYGDYYKKWIYTPEVEEKLEHYIGFSYTDDKGIKWNEYEEIDPNTLGQYTGLVDTSGVKIYDGDVLMKEYDDTISVGFVKYVAPYFRLDSNDPLFQKNFYDFDFNVIFNCKIYVIDNIYDKD